MSAPRGKRLWIYPMAEGSAQALAAAFRACGVDAGVLPAADDETLQLGALHSSGDECLPQRITLGELIKLARRPGHDPARTALFFATTTGPCRFGQYVPMLRRALRAEGLGELEVIAPGSDDGYQSLGRGLPGLPRLAWWAVVGTDLLRKALHRVRPYEREPGESDGAYSAALRTLCATLEVARPNRASRAALAATLAAAATRFASVARRDEPRPLIGVVGEIFCRLHDFSNQDLIRRLERAGGEAWLSDVAEWVWYCNEVQARELALMGRRLSFAMLGARLRDRVQRADEHALAAPFQDLLRGREEAEPAELLEYARPYLPPEGAYGEMVLSVAKVVHLHRKGAHGVIDVSPFTCMNAVVAEALYPRLSRDLDGLPIKTFYFDGKPTPLDRDLEIFVELARTRRAAVG